MGILTPKTGQIAFSDLNVGILNAGSTASLNMNTAAVRLGFGSTGQVALSNLRGCTGGVITVAYRDPTKFIEGGYGFDDIIGPVGSCTGVTYNATPFTISAIFDGDTDANRTFCRLGGTPTAGFRGTNVNRAALADTTRTVSNADTGNFDLAYTMPTTGTVNWGVRFA